MQADLKLAQQGEAKRLALRFPETEAPLLLEGTSELLPEIRRVLRGWTPVASPLDAAAPLAALSAATPCSGGYRIASRYLEAPLEGLPIASAVCALIADASQNFYESKPEALALHCGAFLMRGRLIALMGAAHAGKSTFVARLSAEPDLRILGDDVLPILADGLAHGLGVAPRVRLPLPGNASALFRAHVERHCGLKDELYGYVCAPTVAPFGLRAPLSVLILLDRREGAEAVLRHVPPEEALRHLLAQSMYVPKMEEGPAFVERLELLARSVFCARLTYSDLEPALALLREAFDDEALPSPRARILPAETAEEGGASGAFAADFPSEALWLRSSQARTRVMGEALFLWHGDTGRFLHLNAVGGAIWRLLEAPTSGARITETLAAFFTETDPRRILSDVMALLADLRANALIHPAEGEDRKL